MKNVGFERVDYGWVREKVEEDHDFMYRVYILIFFRLLVKYGNNGIFIYYPSLLLLIVGAIWKQLDFYILFIIITSKSGLIKL